MVSFSLRAFVAFFVFLSVSSVYAQNKVVVIPMAGDDLRTVYEIGKTGPAGGIVFHVTDGGLHGLEASHEDQSVSAGWGCTSTNLSDIVDLSTSSSLDPNTGEHNTQAIIVAGCAVGGAADVASNYMGPNGITTAWYLPNKEELNLLFNQKDVVGGFTSFFYWSSSEISIGNAWAQNFVNGDQVDVNKGTGLRVRAVRAF